MYRTKLNLSFAKLKSEVAQSSLIDCKRYRLTTRAGILQGALDLIRSRRKPLPKPKLSKRKRFDEDIELESAPKRWCSVESLEGLSPRSDSSLSPPPAMAIIPFFQITKRAELSPELYNFNRAIQTQALANFYPSFESSGIINMPYHLHYIAM